MIHSRVYECGSCNKCGLRSKCQKPYKGKQPKNNKRLYISTYYNLLQKDNLSRFTTEYGTLLRVNRSIQVEGAFGVIKQDYQYKRMLRRGKENVEKDLYFIAFGFNLRKLYNHIQANRIGQSLFAINEVA
ncbi:MAG: transposase [Veillonella caviae]|nr:transposase [Veillonella caviae]